MFRHKNPSLDFDHVSFLYTTSRTAQFAINAFPKHVKADEFADLVNVYTNKLKEVRVSPILDLSRLSFFNFSGSETTAWH